MFSPSFDDLSMEPSVTLYSSTKYDTLYWYSVILCGGQTKKLDYWYCIICSRHDPLHPHLNSVALGQAEEIWQWVCSMLDDKSSRWILLRYHKEYLECR